jgi:hypothetical protein
VPSMYSSKMSSGWDSSRRFLACQIRNFILCLTHCMLTVSSFIAFLSMCKDVLFLF